MTLLSSSGVVEKLAEVVRYSLEASSSLMQRGSNFLNNFFR